MRQVTLPPIAYAHASWEALLEVAPHLGDDWVLIGGQMTLLHTLGNPSAAPRATTDIDLVVDLRVRPDGLARVHRVLTEAGFEQQVAVGTGVGHRYANEAGACFDVLAPYGLGDRHRLSLGIARTLPSQGGSRALARRQDIEVTYGDRSAVIKVADPVGGAVVKAAALYAGYGTAIPDLQRHLQDLETLLPLIRSGHRIRPPLSPSEKRLFRKLASDERLSQASRRSATTALVTKYPSAIQTRSEARRTETGGAARQCSGNTARGRRCKNITADRTGSCYLHRSW